MHCYGLVILPKDEMPSVDGVHRLMEPYGEDWEVEAYEDECRECGGHGVDEDGHDCTACMGEGRELTTRNPNSYWDWYVIGGRWNGVLNGNIVFDKTGIIDHNSILCAKLVLDDIELPHAIVTPDDLWHNYHPTVSYWSEYVRRILWRHAEHYAVVVDFHT